MEMDRDAIACRLPHSPEFCCSGYGASLRDARSKILQVGVTRIDTVTMIDHHHVAIVIAVDRFDNCPRPG